MQRCLPGFNVSLPLVADSMLTIASPIYC
jgi:hypothetical protein